MKKCPQCHNYVDNYAAFCNHCGYNFSQQTGTTPPPPDDDYYPTDNAFDACGPEGKSRGIAALLAIFLGGLGVQYFYLGRISAGIISIVLTAVTCGLWSTVMFIQGILMLCMTNRQFRDKYILSTSSFPLF